MQQDMLLSLSYDFRSPQKDFWAVLGLGDTFNVTMLCELLLDEKFTSPKIRSDTPLNFHIRNNF